MATVKNLSITTLGATLVALGLGGAAQAATVTFDEVPFGQPIDGVSIKGVTFDYKLGGVDSTRASVANYPFGIGGQRPNLVGTGLEEIPNPNPPYRSEIREGVLTLDFAAPTQVLNFDFAITDRFGTATTVELFDPTLTSLGIIPVQVRDAGGFLPRFGSDQFTYNGALVSRAVVNFTGTLRSSTFAIDNITYEPVPEPLTIIGSGMALGFGALIERQYSRKRKKAKQTGA